MTSKSIGREQQERLGGTTNDSLCLGIRKANSKYGSIGFPFAFLNIQ